MREKTSFACCCTYWSSRQQILFIRHIKDIVVYVSNNRLPWIPVYWKLWSSFLVLNFDWTMLTGIINLFFGCKKTFFFFNCKAFQYNWGFVNVVMSRDRERWNSRIKEKLGCLLIHPPPFLTVYFLIQRQAILLKSINISNRDGAVPWLCSGICYRQCHLQSTTD